MNRASNSLWTQNNVRSTRFGPDLGSGHDVHEVSKTVAKDGLDHEESKAVAKDSLDYEESKALSNVRLFQNRRSRWEVEPPMVSCSV